MARFAGQMGGFPSNVCAMTTVTGREKLHRVDQLRKVEASIRGLSIEPLWERIPREKLNLDGIDWVILGGESGRRDAVHPFAIEWARELRDHCQDLGVVFFLKQLGRCPTEGERELKLCDNHGGDWAEWPQDLQVRQVPQAFYDEPTAVSDGSSKARTGAPLPSIERSVARKGKTVPRLVCKSIVTGITGRAKRW